MNLTDEELRCLLTITYIAGALRSTGNMAPSDHDSARLNAEAKLHIEHALSERGMNTLRASLARAHHN